MIFDGGSRKNMHTAKMIEKFAKEFIRIFSK